MTAAQEARAVDLAMKAVVVAMDCCQAARITEADEHLLRAAQALLNVRRLQEQAAHAERRAS